MWPGLIPLMMAELDKSGVLDYHFVEEPPDSLVCPVCLLPCREPHLISCCGKKVCHSCISRVQQNDQPCPLCRTPQFITLLDREVERQILNLKVYCNNKEDGCTWTGELRQLEGHLNSCNGCNVLCKYKCRFRCPWQQMLIHERDECELRPEIILTKTLDELTKRVADLESTCKNQSLVIKRQQAIFAVTNVGSQELESVQQRLDVAQAQIATLEQNMNGVARELDKEKADNQELRKQLAAKENEVNIMQQNICEMVGSIKEPHNQLPKDDPSSNKVDRQVLEPLQLAYDQGHKEDEVCALKELVDKLDAELKEFQIKHDERIAEKNLVIENLQESLETKETALNGMKDQETTMKRSIETLNVENGQLKRQIDDLQKRLGNYAPPQQGQPPPYNPVYPPPPQRPQPPPQRSEAATRQCPVCNLAYPTRMSQQEFERHVNSHFHWLN